MAKAGAKKDNRTLPSKENGMFRQIVKFYESKQYKKGIKMSDQILKRFPDHGETLAMRGLTLNCMNKKEEAHDFVRKGLRNDLMSHVCWHVYGLLHRSERNYQEAIKCYLQALKIKKDDQQIMRDLSLLQIQMRNLDGYVNTRRALLTLKPQNRNNWISFCIAHHMNGSFQQALKIMDAYLKTLEEKRPASYEDSEMMLYKAQLFDEGGQKKEALDFLNSTAAQRVIMDKLGMNVMKGRLFLELGEWDEAEKVYLDLLEINAEQYSYHCGYQCAILKTAEYVGLQGCDLPCNKSASLTLEQRLLLSQKYESFQEKEPKCNAHARIALHLGLVYTEDDGGDEAARLAKMKKLFFDRLGKYLRLRMEKGVPSLFSDVTTIYRLGGQGDAFAQEQVAFLEEVVTSYKASLGKGKTFPLEEKKQPATTFLWVSYFLAQHYDRLGDMQKAIVNIDDCLRHTPTAIELYQMKSKILRHAGDINAAYAVVEHGRTLDLQDRYINNRATKYALLSDKEKIAEETISLFTKHDGDTEGNLFDMQCMWYELLIAESYHRQGQYGKALKKFTAVEKHFFDIQEDQFDFHTYCIRKMTLRSYVRMLRVEDELKSHKNYVRAACGVVRCYLELHKSPPPKRTEDGEIDYSHMTPAEKKKAKAQARREATQKRKEEELKKEEQKRQEEEDNRNKKDKKRRRPQPREVDADPQGELLAAKPQLEEAWKYCQLLQKHCSAYLEAHTTAFDVALLRGKYMLCLKSIITARKLDPQSPQVFRRTVNFLHLMLPKDGNEPAMFGEKNAAVYKVIKSECEGILCGKSLADFVADYANAHTSSMLHSVAVSEVKFMLDPSPAQRTTSLATMTSLKYPKDFSDVHCEECTTGASLKSCIEVCKTLQRVFLYDGQNEDASAEATDALNKFKQQCKEIFPCASFFGNKVHLCSEMLVNITAEEAAKETSAPVVGV